jgi:hypothetical protein
MKTFGKALQMKPIILAFLLLGLIPLKAFASGGAFYCGNDLIQPGDRKIEVLHACGEPDFVDTWEEILNRGYFRFGHFWPSVEQVKVEEWTYNFGPNRFIRILRFENGELVRIRDGDYGFPKEKR